MRSRQSHPASRPLMLALTLLVATLAAGCGGDEPESVPPPVGDEVRARTATAELRPVPVALESTGGVEPWRSVSPGTKLMGRIDRVEVREGQPVAAGELLVALDQRDLEAALQQAEAGVRVAEAQLENVTAQHDRIQALHARGSATDKDLEDMQAARRTAEAGIEQARANVETARVMLGYAEVRAPFAGRVVARHVESGDMARPGAPLVTLEDLSRVKVTVQVPEARIVDLEPGAPAVVEIDVLDGSFEARVVRIVPAADRGSRTFDVQLVLANPEQRIRSGMFARARFPGRVREALVVPASAVVRRGQLEGVFVVDGDGIARLRWVRLGADTEGAIEVLSGIEPGETYVVEPPATMRDGSRVVGS